MRASVLVIKEQFNQEKGYLAHCFLSSVLTTVNCSMVGYYGPKTSLKYLVY